VGDNSIFQQNIALILQGSSGKTYFGRNLLSDSAIGILPYGV
jgi:hypothetical protein